MHDLAKERLNKNFKQSVKYLTLVFNDFFILALIFLFGALMFWYAQSLKTMPRNLWFYRPLIGLLIWLPLLTGHLVTLLQKADMQFLLPQDEQMGEYLRPLLVYSHFLPFLLEILLLGIVFPFARVKAGISLADYLLLAAAMFLVKDTEIQLEKSNLYFGRKIEPFLLNCGALVLAFLAAYWPWVGILLAAFASILSSRLRRKGPFDWRYAVQTEQLRKDRVYSVFNMFTDVAEKQVVIKRRKYLDFLLLKSLAHENPNLFLYRRSLLRNPDYLNLLVRMTVFAILLSGLVQDWRWAVGLSALVVFLTAYQLLPLASEFDRNVMYRVYPINRDNRGQDLVKAIALALGLQWLLISLFWLLELAIDLHLLLAMGILLLFTLLLVAVYLPHKVKDLDKKR